jgi:hypothetical protein
VDEFTARRERVIVVYMDDVDWEFDRIQAIIEEGRSAPVQVRALQTELLWHVEAQISARAPQPFVRQSPGPAPKPGHAKIVMKDDGFGGESDSIKRQAKLAERIARLRRLPVA